MINSQRLDEASRRDKARKLLANSVDLGDKKKNDKIEQSEAHTFEEIAIERHARCSRQTKQCVR